MQLGALQLARVANGTQRKSNFFQEFINSATHAFRAFGAHKRHLLMPKELLSKVILPSRTAL
jgi:hypothetical protein